jgi:hypothetical protein
VAGEGAEMINENNDSIRTVKSKISKAPALLGLKVGIPREIAFLGGFKEVITLLGSMILIEAVLVLNQ